MARLGVARLDLMYAHIEDPSVPVEETVGAFGELVASGEVGLLGCLAAVDLELTAAQRARLDEAH
jgi:aryl-alcohol dehydrogenase-like predicted oxidoreductase